MIPYSDVPFNKLTYEQRREREKGMASEAARLIEARRAVQRPSQPVQVNAIPAPPASGRSLEEIENLHAANELIERMAARDRGNAS